jgi:small subunit ribosomal protein S1
VATERYPHGARSSGRRGAEPQRTSAAFVESDDGGVDGLLHVSDMSWTRQGGAPRAKWWSKGQESRAARCLSVDTRRAAGWRLGLKQMAWRSAGGQATSRRGYQGGPTSCKGTVTPITTFGVFVGLEDGLEGLLHGFRTCRPQGQQSGIRGRGWRRGGTRF